MSKQDRLYQKLTPIFDPDLGKRMGIIRMKMLMDQTELGQLLAVSQQMISNLESGKTRVTDSFNYARFKAIFGDFTSYIMNGADSSSINPAYIRQRYWETKLKTRRKPGSGLWKKDLPLGAAAIQWEIKKRELKKDGEGEEGE